MTSTSPSKPLVSVRWLDAHASATNELQEHELPSEPVEYTIHGLLVKDCEKGIVIASEETKEHSFRGWTFIPRVLIVDIKYHQKKRVKKVKPVEETIES